MRRVCFLILPTLLGVNVGGLGRPAPVEPTFDASRWPYPLYAEVVTQLQHLPRRYPKLARLHTIGKSGEGRDLSVLEITNADTGPGESKPGIWMDGNIHGHEVTGRQLLMYFAERLLANYGKDAEATALVDTRTFYVMPVLDVDGGERTLTRHPAWPGHKAQEQAGRDLDGDGFITQIRVKDPDGDWYPSPTDPRVMLQVRTQNGGRWNYVPTTATEPVTIEDDLAPRDRRYRIFIEGDDTRRASSAGRERADFNRNWSAEWKPEQVGAGPFPFSLPETHAVASFMTSHRNIFFHDTVHSGGGFNDKNYIVRPPMAHPFEFMPPEDNDFYLRMSAAWSAISDGGLMNSDYYSQVDHPGLYGQPNTGFANDWAYMHLGIHSLLPEIAAAGKDYDRDGYITIYELLRWNDEEKGGRYFAPWKPFRHPVLGDIEIGGLRGMPQAVDEGLRRECDNHYRLMTHIAGLSPLLRLQEPTSTTLPDGTVRIEAAVQNIGFLSTYVTRQALAIKRDYPVVVRLTLDGGTLVEGEPVVTIGHILGRLAYVRRWGFGADESIRRLTWRIRPGAGPVTATIEAQAHKAGRDRRTLRIPAGTGD